MLDAPILFIVFNRPENTYKVFESIRKAKPKRLYIVADGPRLSHPEDAAKCAEVRKIVSHIDWECELFTDFKDENVGVEYNIKKGLDWFFSREKYGMVLEDDCLPNPSFFIFCERLLKKYETDERINLIAGSTNCEKRLSKKYRYFIGDMGSTWGWASWARAFHHFEWGNRYALKDIYAKMLDVYGADFTDWQYGTIRHSYEKEGNWDVEFFVHNLMNNKKSITPAVNLISNIGNVGTHFNNHVSKRLFLPTTEMHFDKSFEDNFSEMPAVVKKKIIQSILDKENPLSFRDRLYLLKKRIQHFLK